MENNTNKKIKTREEIIKISEDLKKQGKIIVTTNGSFDLLHIGHIKFLEEAKKQGSTLIIGLNTDNSVKKWKKSIGYKDWKNRPLNNEKNRSEMLAALECVDYVTLFDETDCLTFIESVKPNIHVNGSEYGEDCIEAETVKNNGGKIHIVKIIGNHSTSNLIKKIKNMDL
jgi:D-glycero-beta-D-manno-heptose 1-phosphate adenylyltransferase